MCCLKKKRKSSGYYKNIFTVWLFKFHLDTHFNIFMLYSYIALIAHILRNEVPHHNNNITRKENILKDVVKLHQDHEEGKV